jgi:hypothetical protein
VLGINAAIRLEVWLGPTSKAGYTDPSSSTANVKGAGRIAKDVVKAAEPAQLHRLNLAFVRDPCAIVW